MMKIAMLVALAVLSPFAVAGTQDAQFVQIAELLSVSDGDAPPHTRVVHRIFYFYNPKAALTVLLENREIKMVSLPIKIKVKAKISTEKSPIVLKGDKTLIVTRQPQRIYGIRAIDSQTIYTLSIEDTGSGVVLSDKKAKFVMTMTEACCVAKLRLGPTADFLPATQIAYTVEQFENGISQGVVLVGRSFKGARPPYNTSAEERPSTMTQLGKLLLKVKQVRQ